MWSYYRSRNSPFDSLWVQSSKEWPNINQRVILVSKRTLKIFLDIISHIYGQLKDLQMLDQGEICDELRAIAQSVVEWGNKLLEENVFPAWRGCVPFQISKTRCFLRSIMNEIMCCFIHFCSLISFALFFLTHHHVRFMAYAIYTIWRCIFYPIHLKCLLMRCEASKGCRIS